VFFKVAKCGPITHQEEHEAYRYLLSSLGYASRIVVGCLADVSGNLAVSGFKAKPSNIVLYRRLL
jgi:hypothetical protein